MKMPSNVYLIGAASAWGIQPTCIKLLLRQFTSSSVILIRSTCMMIVYIFLMRRSCATIIPHISLRKWVLLVGMGLTGTTICCIFQYEGLKIAPVSHNLIFSSVVPAITSLLAYIFLREKLVWLQWFGIILSSLGVLVMLTQGDIHVLTNEGFNIGDIFLLINEISWACYIILGRVIMKDVPPVQVTAWSSIFGVLTYLPFVLYTGDIGFSGVEPENIGQFLFIIFISGALSNIWWNKGIHLLGAKGAIYNNSTPFVGIFFGWLILGEGIHVFDILGFALVLIGIYLLMYRSMQETA